ncbi:hypothetical protein L9F63_006296, partial [Diploptera punctata]
LPLYFWLTKELIFSQTVRTKTTKIKRIAYIPEMLEMLSFCINTSTASVNFLREQHLFLYEKVSESSNICIIVLVKNMANVYMLDIYRKTVYVTILKSSVVFVLYDANISCEERFVIIVNNIYLNCPCDIGMYNILIYIYNKRLSCGFKNDCKLFFIQNVCHHCTLMVMTLGLFILSTTLNLPFMNL